MTPTDAFEATPRRRVLRTVALCLAVPAVLGVAVVAGTLAWHAYHGIPLIDEWECTDGEIPASNEAGGSACFSADSPVPDGWTAHPLGNRPLVCDDRRGWIEVESQLARWGGSTFEPVTGCLAQDAALPAGWVRSN